MPNYQWKKIAENYRLERDTKSFPHLLIDKLIASLIGGKSFKILDFGAGSGTISRLISKENSQIIAYEPVAEMRHLLERSTPKEKYKNIKIVDELKEVKKIKNLDGLICVNVLNHIKNVPVILRVFSSLLKKEGQLVISLPHPLKNHGTWEKKNVKGKWNYAYYRLDDYMKEGKIERTREDINGNVVVKKVISYHRKFSTYYNWIEEAGFEIKRIYEPAPSRKDAKNFPILYSKSSRIPYFLIFKCVKTK